MNSFNSLIKRDLQHHFHPCSQMKDFIEHPPLIVKSAKGSYIYTDKGPIIDAISSWWCKSLGHSNSEIINAISTQLNTFEHVITANCTNDSIVELSEELSKLSQLDHIFFASDGSSAVEIALKMALQAKQILEEHDRSEFLALKNGYHGETFATLSVSDLGLYKAPFANFGLKTHFINPITYIPNKNDSLWSNAEKQWQETREKLEPIKHKICALIFEPIIQGAGGMLVYSQDFLKRLCLWARQNNIYLIADEIMTGFGRTGKYFACDHAAFTPDLICVSKGLTSGTLPLSAVLIDKKIYDLFYDDYGLGKSFLHSHTYSGNALGVSAALATIKIMQQLNINQQAEKLGQEMFKNFSEIGKLTGKIKNIRTFGAMVAGDLQEQEENSTKKRLGFELYKKAIAKGALIRPLGNTIYWLPPLNTDFETIEKLSEITLNSINELYQN